MRCSRRTTQSESPTEPVQIPPRVRRTWRLPSQTVGGEVEYGLVLAAKHLTWPIAT